MQTNTRKNDTIQNQIDKLDLDIQHCYENIERYDSAATNQHSDAMRDIAAYEEDAYILMQRRAELVRILHNTIKIAQPFSQLLSMQY